LPTEGKLTDRQKKNSEHRQDTSAAERCRKLLDEWMADESGYDEEAWPELKEALDRNRREAGQYRNLFD
jgi:hypothetical protein